MEIQNFLPVAYRTKLGAQELIGAEEIRLRVGQPLEVVYADGKSCSFGRLSMQQLREMLNYLSGYSLYCMEEELRQGFFTLAGGHRVGVVGRISYRNQGGEHRMDGLWDISGLNIRIAHEKKGCAREILPWIYRGEGIYHTFLFAPPGVGKTTFLRDCIRLLSNGTDRRRGLKVGVVDERSEIAACHRGIPQNDLGARTDVLDNCPKEQGMRMLLRSMSPEILAVDELGEKREFATVAESAKSGVAVLATMHADTVFEVQNRLAKEGLEGLFPAMRLIGIGKQPSGKRRLHIYEGSGAILWQDG